jgi:hypothetical protein
MTNEEWLDFYETNKDMHIELFYYEMRSSISLENLFKLFKLMMQNESMQSHTEPEKD